MTDIPLNQDINYLQGQIHGLRALVLGLANLLLEKDAFRQEGVQRIEMARTALLMAPVMETTLDGLNEVETWLLNVTG
jgi:hypothetical protein